MDKDNKAAQATQTAQLMTRAEAARFLRLSPGTLGNWRCSKRVRIPCVRLGWKIFYRASDLEKFIESRVENKVQEETVKTQCEE